MEKTIEIPEGYEAQIEGNKVILKPKESEDEKIRKEMLNSLKEAEDCIVFTPFKKKSWIAYLERQKEQKPANDRYMEGYMEGYAKGHKDAENSYNRGVSYHFDNPNIQRLDPNVVIESKTGEMHPDVVRGTLTGGESIEDKDATEPTPKQDYSGLTDFERALHRGFLCAGVENVPIGIIKDTAQDCLAHIKPAEWSEEDEALLKEIVSFFKDGTVKLQHDLDLYAGFLENKLKSLHPQPHLKPSEEQRHIEGQDTCHLNKQKLVNFIEDCIAENLENTTDANHDNHEGYHQACWDIIYRINQMCK